MNKTWTTGTGAWAAAEQINTTKAVKCSEWRGRVSGDGCSSENSSSGKKCQLHPHYREREEGSPWGMYSHNHRGLQTNHQLLGESVFLTNANHLLNENLNFRDISKVLISNWLWEMGPCIHIKQVKILYCCKRVLTHMLQVQHFIKTPGLKSQQWLQVQCRITFKILVLVHKAFNGLAPPVHLTCAASLTQLDLSGQQVQIFWLFPKLDLSVLRCFSYCGPVVWNKHPTDLRSITTVSTCKNRLKPYYPHRLTVV